MAAARRPLSRIPGLQFWKLCGSGTGEGFTPSFNSGVFAILCAWQDRTTAETRLRDDNLFFRYRQKSCEDWTIFLAPVSVRGAWSGQTPFVTHDGDLDGPLAALTRATLRPRILLGFWRRTPAISQVIGADRNVAFKIGIGEVPYLQQVTFSIWPDAESMAAFARMPGGPHAEAIRAVREENWFREELYARFRILGDSGSWFGKSPLEKLELQ